MTVFAFSVNYCDRDDASPGMWVHRGFWLHDLPRLMLVCRIIGHRPVVDGTKSSHGGAGARWVVCDRCGVRPEPQGSLDPNRWNVGDRYTGPWGGPAPTDPDERFTVFKAYKDTRYPPGTFPAKPAGAVGGEFCAGRKGMQAVGFSLKVGNGGSEQTLAASIHLWWVSLYLHTERFGTWLQRRLNPVGYESKVIELEAHNGRLWWKLWARRNGWSGDDPKWRHGSLQIDPRTLLLGPKRYAYTDHGAKVTETVHMPHGDEHPVHLQLQRQALGRKRGRKRLSWSVDWDAPRGIPTRPDGRGRICGSGVAVPDDAVANGTWPAAAAARIADRLAADRARNDWNPAATVA